jgi:hypothetical protein
MLLGDRHREFQPLSGRHLLGQGATFTNGALNIAKDGASS